MVALNKYEIGIDYKSETYTNGKLENSMSALWDRMSETDKKVYMILHSGRIIIKGPNPEMIENYFIGENISFDESKYITQSEDTKYLIKEKLETLNGEILEKMLTYFKEESWKILRSHPINNPPNKIRSKS